MICKRIVYKWQHFKIFYMCYVKKMCGYVVRSGNGILHLLHLSDENVIIDPDVQINRRIPM